MSSEIDIKVLTSEGETTRSFRYKKDKVDLSFSLRVDIKSELKDFLECLKVASKDVEEELNKQ